MCILQTKSKEQVVSFLTAYAPQHTFAAAGKKLLASIHGVLLGHEDWVHSVAWIPRYDPAAAAVASTNIQSTNRFAEMPVDGGPGAPEGSQGGSCSLQAQPQHSLQLLTASMDRTIMIWGPDKASGLWMCEESVGDAGVIPCYVND